MVYGLGTFGARATTAAFTACKSCTNLHSSGWPTSRIFFTGNIGVFTGESAHGIIIPRSSSDSNTGVMPSNASRLTGYCGLCGL